MAWYRCGGGGIPSSLKSDMNDVFNKKFGTTLQDYPPDEWPGTVNLMGPLPEKNVSGSVVTFSDGADDVPLKSCEVTISPNLDGVSSVDVVKTGKNLLLSGATSDTINGVTFTVNSDGSVTVNGTASENTAFPICNIYLKSGSYILSGAPATGQSTTYEFQVLASNGTTYREYGSGRPFTLAQGTDGLNEVRILIRKNYVANNLVFYPQLELGSTASAYEPINGTTHTAQLGRTIYGGEVDVVNGTGTETSKKITFSALTWTYDSTYNRFLSSAVSGIKIQSGRTLPMVCDNYTVIDDGRPLSNVPDMSIYNSGNSGGFYVHDARYTTVEDFLQNMVNTVVCYPIATPETFTFTPVPIITRLGDNTLWGDGDLSVTYRRDIDLALAQ